MGSGKSLIERVIRTDYGGLMKNKPLSTILIGVLVSAAVEFLSQIFEERKKRNQMGAVTPEESAVKSGVASGDPASPLDRKPMALEAPKTSGFGKGLLIGGLVGGVLATLLSTIVIPQVSSKARAAYAGRAAFRHKRTGEKPDES